MEIARKLPELIIFYIIMLTNTMTFREEYEIVGDSLYGRELTISIKSNVKTTY